MPILGHKPGRMRFVSFSFSDAGAFGTFRRDRNRAVVYELLGFLPVGRKSISLDDISAVKVRKSEQFDGSAKYGIALRRKEGSDLHFGCYSRDEAMSLMREITKFLELDRD